MYGNIIIIVIIRVLVSNVVIYLNHQFAKCFEINTVKNNQKSQLYMSTPMLYYYVVFLI